MEQRFGTQLVVLPGDQCFKDWLTQA